MAQPQQKDALKKQLFFTGEWIPSIDPLKIGQDNFAVLENCRYASVGVEGVLGYTKINVTSLTNAAYAGYFKGRSGRQVKSSYADQDRVVIQAYNTGLTGSSVIENLAVVPAQMQFDANRLWDDAAGADLGRFSRWPNGNIAYCNGLESCVYSGNESRCPSFKVYDPDGGFKYDYSSVIGNMDEDVKNVAVLHRVSESIDADTVALWHFDNSPNDATTNAHNLTAQGGATYSAAQFVFGTHSADLDGVNSYFTAPDHADFDFSGGTLTVDTRVRLNALPAAGTNFALYYQESSAVDYFRIVIDEDGKVVVRVCVDDGGGGESVTVTMETDAATIAIDTWYHVEVVESGDNWYIFVDGVLKAYLSDTDRCANYTSTVRIGYDGRSGAGYYLNGYLDEFRVSSAARHTADFELPAAAYGSYSYRTYAYIGSSRPIKGIKAYVKTANTTAGTLNLEYWNGVAWASVALLVDQTEVAGVPLAQTGTISFTSTVDLAEVRVIDSTAIYWYRLTVTECDATTTLYHVSLDMPFQEIKDVWDGTYRTLIGFQLYKSSTYNDNTTNVARHDYSSLNEATYAQLGGLTAAQFAVMGTTDRLMGVTITLVSGAVNTNAAVLTVSYWDGSDWVSVGPINDGTIESGKSMAKTGTVTWNPPSISDEFRREVSSEVPLFYYKFAWSATLSANVRVDYIGGISAPRELPGGWKFPFMFGNRPMLCGYMQGNEGNRVDYGMANTTDVWNGEDSSESYAGSLYFGGSEELTAACEIFNRFGAAIYNLGVFCKRNETYSLNGSGPDDFEGFTISNKVGCPAPLTMDTAELGYAMEEGGGGRNVAIWLSYSGPVIFDGAVIVPIGQQVENYFDSTKTECINFDAIENARGWVESDNLEYNLAIPSGAAQTTPNVWLCFDLTRRRWFHKVPVNGTSPYPGAAFRVTDDYGTEYVYGLFDDGYMRRLENGPTWDGTGITQRVKTADMIPTSDIKGGGIWDYVSVDALKVVTEVIAEDADVAVTHYRDGNTTGQTLQPVKSTGSNRFKRKTQKLSAAGNGYSHQFEFSVTTSTTEKGVPLLGWGMIYSRLREDIRDAEE